MRLLTVLFCLIFTLNLTHAQSATAEVHEFTLDNGLKLLVKQDDRAPVAVFMIWYRVGSSDEPNGITGISHALEHMMFQGTKKYPAGQVMKLVAENGGKQNAFTSTDFTAYFEMFAADKLPVAFDIEADRMQNLTLNSENIMREMQVIMEERRMRTDDNPQALTYERLNAAAFLSIPYHHPVIGWMNDIQNINTDDLKQWYNTWYTPNNATIVIVGDVKADDMLAMTKHYFGEIKARPLPEIKPHTAVPQLGERSVTVRRPATLPYLFQGYNVPSVPANPENMDPYALTVLAAILDGGESARLTANLVRKDQVASAISASYDPFTRFSGLFLLSGTPTQQTNIEQLDAAITEQIGFLKNDLVTEQELATVKAQVIAQKVYDQDSMMGQAMELGYLTSVGMPWQEKDDFIDKIQSITPEQVRTVARLYLNRDHLTTAELSPLPIEPATPDQNQE